MIKNTTLYLMTYALTMAAFAGEGQTFNIEEDSMHETFTNLPSLLKERALKTEQTYLDEIIKKIQTPNPVAGLEEAKEYRFFYYDPIYTVEEEVTDLKGNVIASKGQIINPMAGIQNLQDLIFFDGTNPKHIQWAQSQPQAKWILITGSPFEVEETTNHDVYFDQMGALCKKFGIERVPSKISQKNERLLIEEIPCEG